MGTSESLNTCSLASIHQVCRTCAGSASFTPSFAKSADMSGSAATDHSAYRPMETMRDPASFLRNQNASVGNLDTFPGRPVAVTVEVLSSCEVSV